MRHVFRATKIGWAKEQECVWFDSDHYTKEEAEAEFKPYEATTQRGYPYTGYEYDGQKYHDVTYLGEFDITIKGFKVELELTKVAWVKLAGLEFYGHQTL